MRLPFSHLTVDKYEHHPEGLKSSVRIYRQSTLIMYCIPCTCLHADALQEQGPRLSRFPDASLEILETVGWFRSMEFGVDFQMSERKRHRKHQ